MTRSSLKIRVAGASQPKKTVRVECLLDSGVFHTVISRKILERLGVRPLTREAFRLSNGKSVVREKGVAVFHYRKCLSMSNVIFGEPGDCNLLGSITLGSLGFVLDPLSRKITPLPMILAACA